MPLVVDLFRYSYDRDFMMSLPDSIKANDKEAFNSTLRCIDNRLNIRIFEVHVYKSAKYILQNLR